MKFVETKELHLVKKIVPLPEISKQSKLCFLRNLVVWVENGFLFDNQCQYFFVFSDHVVILTRNSTTVKSSPFI